ncbi:MAG: hypothetical protein K0U84_18295 [Actinomycetia bacterium]|nr:hypothetical protein [Actinomycetes bacterium]
MRVGLIARADSRGLGIQTKAFYDNMAPAKTLVVGTDPRMSEMPLPIRSDWYPDAAIIRGWPTASHIEAFLDGVDTVYTAETGYTPALWDIAQKRGIRTVLHANFEFLNRNDQPTQWLAPSEWRIDEWPEGTVHLPFPVETHRFGEPDLPDLPTNLLHIVGRPTIDKRNDREVDLNRNGTIDLLQCLQHTTANFRLTVRCQKNGYVDQLMQRHHVVVPHNVDLRIEQTDLPNYWDAYQGQHALILPRRFGGLCLPANEAVGGAGIPAIMTDIDPNNRWLPREWLVPAVQTGSLLAKQFVDVHTPDPVGLALKIEQLVTDPAFYADAKRRALQLRFRLSWDTLKPYYEEMLRG